MSKEFKLPQNLLLGVATASKQIEGGDTDSNWNDWYERGEIRDAVILLGQMTIIIGLRKILI